jgi:hypothetical protein
MPEKKYDDYALVCHRRFRKEKKMYVVSQRKSDALGVQNFFLGAPIRALLNTGSSGVRKRTIPKRGRSPIDADRPTSTAAERAALHVCARKSRSRRRGKNRLSGALTARPCARTGAGASQMRVAK